MGMNVFDRNADPESIPSPILAKLERWFPEEE